MSDESKPAESGPAALHGMLAEYESPKALISAAEKVRNAGFRDWDTYTPFPIHGIDPAMGIRATILPWIILGGGLTGLTTAILLQWWTNAYDYPFIISGKPFWSIPANVPVMFELTVLFSAFAAFFGMLGLNKLPHPSHPLDYIKRFGRSNVDRFYVFVQASDPVFDEKETRLTSVAEVPRGLVYALLIIAAASTVPFALAAYARETKSRHARIHVVPDMDFQQKFKGQRMNTFFADKHADRPQVDGTIAWGELHDDEHMYQGKVGGVFVRAFPPNIKTDEATMARGRERFGVYCTPCHGQTGEGDGMVSLRAASLAEGTWVPPSNLTEERLRVMPVGELTTRFRTEFATCPATPRRLRRAIAGRSSSTSARSREAAQRPSQT
jgi:hypothetical protein